MKKILVVATWILGTTLSGFAQDADPAAGPLDNTIPDQLAKIVGSGAWFYMWPHGHLPLEPDGYALKSAPVDFTMPQGGRSKHAWGMDSVYLSADKQVTITARLLGYHSLEEMKGQETMFAISPEKYWREPVHFAAFAFHETIAASGAPSKTEPGRTEFYLAFRVDNRLFMLEGKGSGKGVDTKTAVLKLAERIHSRYKQRLQSGPRD